MVWLILPFPPLSQVDFEVAGAEEAGVEVAVEEEAASEEEEVVVDVDSEVGFFTCVAKFLVVFPGVMIPVSSRSLVIIFFFLFTCRWKMI